MNIKYSIEVFFINLMLMYFRRKYKELDFELDIHKNCVYIDNGEYGYMAYPAKADIQAAIEALGNEKICK